MNTIGILLLVFAIIFGLAGIGAFIGLGVWIRNNRRKKDMKLLEEAQSTS